MTEFDREVVSKKKLVPSARKRKGGSKSKRCSLPSDSLTKKQLERLNGPVSTYQMDRPIKWTEFKALPSDLQVEYMNNIIVKYGVNASAVSKMFGVRQSTLSTYMKTAGIRGDIHLTGKHVKKDRQEAWEQFLSGENELTEDNSVSDDNQQTELGSDQDNSVPAEPAKRGSLTSFSVEFNGEINPIDIANMIQHIVGNNAYGCVEIRCTLDDKR